MYQETWICYRKVVQAWTETIATVAKNDFGKHDFDLLESAVLRSSSMDAEICTMLARKPRTFHLNMLPICQQEAKSDVVAREIAKAHTEASQARLHVFEMELVHDWAHIELMRIAKGH